MEDCIVLARTLGERVGRELKIPVFLYERAATRPDARESRRRPARRVRGTSRRDRHATPQRKPDFGPAKIHPTAGAVAIGARPFLVAYNVYLGPAIEPAGREGRRQGGARLVRRTALREGARPRGRRPGAGVDEPRRHREDAAPSRVRHGEDGSRGAGRDADVERDRRARPRARAVRDRRAPHPAAQLHAGAWCSSARCAQAVQGGESLTRLRRRRSRRRSPTPGGGSVAAHAGALGAALAQMVAGLTVGKKKYAAVDAEMRELALKAAALVQRRSSALVARDAAAYARGRRRVQAAEGAGGRRRRAQDGDRPTRCSAPRRCRSRRRAPAPRSPSSPRSSPSKGNTNAVSDAGVAALLAEAALPRRRLQRAHQRRVARRQVARRGAARGDARLVATSDAAARAAPTSRMASWRQLGCMSADCATPPVRLTPHGTG